MVRPRRWKSAPRPARCRRRNFPHGAASGDLTLWLALLFAFLGGLILNVMPCVLPILAMKALALARSWQRAAAAKALPMPQARC